MLPISEVLAFIYDSVGVHTLALTIPLPILPLASVLEELGGVGAHAMGFILLEFALILSTIYHYH